MDQITEKHRKLISKAIISIYGQKAYRPKGDTREVLPLYEWDDLFNAGVVGLIQADERFDPNKKTAFSTFAYFRIRGAIVDFIRENDFIPVSRRRKVTSLAKIFALLSQEKKRRITAEDIAIYLNKDPKKLIPYEVYFEEDHRNKYMSERKEVRPKDHKNTKFITLEDLCPDPKWRDPFNKIEQKDFDIFIGKIMNELPAKQRLVVYLHYFRDKKFKDIADMFGLSESRVCQISKQGLKAMKKKISKEFDNEPYFSLV